MNEEKIIDMLEFRKNLVYQLMEDFEIIFEESSSPSSNIMEVFKFIT